MRHTIDFVFNFIWFLRLIYFEFRFLRPRSPFYCQKSEKYIRHWLRAPSKTPIQRINTCFSNYFLNYSTLPFRSQKENIQQYKYLWDNILSSKSNIDSALKDQLCLTILFAELFLIFLDKILLVKFKWMQIGTREFSYLWNVMNWDVFF